MILRRPLRQIVIALGVGAVGVAVLAMLASRGRLAHHWGTDWDSLPDADVPVRMRQLAELGDDGLATIAEALGSDRQAVAQAAEATLRQQVDAWHEVPLKQSAPKISHLVGCLAKQCPEYGPKARRAAADLATLALLWPVDRGGPNRDRLVHDCAKLMRAAADSPWTPGDNDRLDTGNYERVASDSSADETSAVGVRRIVVAGDGGTNRVAPAPHPGGGLPIETAQVPAVPSPPESQNELVLVEPSQRSQPPATNAERDDEAADASTGETVDEATVDDDTPPARFEPALSRRIPWQPPRRRNESNPTDPPGRRMGGNLTRQIDELSSRDDLSVMRQLHAGDRQQVQLAREELNRRGFDERHLVMAEDVTNPDPQVRLRFAQALPRIRDVDIRPWLRTLADDDHPDVRLAAIAIIATTGLPDSSSWLRELELRERDPRVTEQLRRVLNRR